jgi:hypothetical protein
MGQRAKTLASSGALALQGPFIAYLSRQSPGGYVVLSVASVALALVLAEFKGRSLALMASMGTLAMLVGWFSDAGFRPLVGAGVCLCGCTDSLAGLGLISHFHWMQACMLTACAAATVVEAREQPAPCLGRIALQVAASSVMMIAGMAAFGWTMSTVRFPSAASSLLASYLAMSAGMVAGCALALRLSPDARDNSHPSETRPSGCWAPGPPLDKRQS